MDASCAAAATTASKPEMNNADSNGTAVPNGGDGAGGTFAPSVWGDFFITYVPPPTQRSEEWMRERAEELKRRVRGMFEDVKAKPGMSDVVTLVDMLERLGVDGHFHEEITAAISHIHHAGKEESVVGSDNLHVVATQFRLLRQHGIWVSTDVFDKFRDGAGNFSTSLSSDPRALLSLYNAAHMAVPGDADTTLDDAMAFTRCLLQEMANKGELLPPRVQQVARALNHPLPRFPRQLEAARYIVEYALEETHDGVLLELARLNSNLMRSLHLKELKDLSLGWRDLYDAVNLTYARDRMVEFYFWTCGVIDKEEHSRARLMFAKTFGLASLLDDTYDAHATLEECRGLNKAMQIWDKSGVSVLPGYLHMMYIRTLSIFNEFEDLLEPNEKYRMPYARKAFQLLSGYYMQEAQWSNDKYQPSFTEHEEVSIKSSGMSMLILVALMGYDVEATQEVFEWTSAIPDMVRFGAQITRFLNDMALMGYDVEATQEVFEWTSAIPDMVRFGAQITRFLNDISSYKLGKNKTDVASAVECYMLENDVSGDEAVAAIATMIEHRWRVVNQACMEIDKALLPVAELVVNFVRINEDIYLRGRDGYTFGGDLKDHVAALFLDPIPL